MTELLQLKMTTHFFSNRNKLWWLGLFLADLGLILWLISIIEPTLLPILNLLSANDLTAMEQIGFYGFQFALGFGSAVTLGWGITIMAASLNFTKEVQTYLAVGITIWYILDGISSYLSQFYLNILSNTVLLLIAIYVLFNTETTEVSID